MNEGSAGHADDPSLKDLHDLAWSAIEGAHVVVRMEVDDNDIALPPSEWSEGNVYPEIREGEVVGRGQGTGLSYDARDAQLRPSRIGPSVYLDTVEDTVLEVRTNKPENELLAFEPREGADGD